MATKLTKVLKRELTRQSMIVTLNPGDTITFRKKGKRTSFTCTLGHCYNLAMIIEAEHLYAERMKIYKLRGNKRMRKPKRPQFPYSNIYFKATK